MTTFSAAPLDRGTRLVSAAFCIALLGLSLSLPPATGTTAGLLLGTAVPLLIVVAAFGFAPAAYELSPDGVLRVKRRLFGQRTFRVDAAEPVSELFGLGTIRLMVSGGAFGWYGVFWRGDSGRYRSYVTDRRRLVLCAGPDGRVVISPSDPDGFLAAVPSTS